VAALSADAVAAGLNDGAVTGCTVELTDAASVDDAARDTIARHGHIDVLVNNAGITGGNAPAWEITPEVWRRVIDVNLTGSYLTIRAIVPQMIERGYGRIVNVASIAGKEGNPNMIPYSTAKAGVIGFTKALAKEVAQLGIYVNAIAPAVIETPILQQLTPEQVQYMVQRIPLGRVGQPHEVAALVAWLASDECTFTTGQCIDISGGRATY
jgi:3-oxoacyl-[acyl-carrier protein] reductase